MSYLIHPPAASYSFDKLFLNLVYPVCDSGILWNYYFLRESMQSGQAHAKDDCKLLMHLGGEKPGWPYHSQGYDWSCPTFLPESDAVKAAR